MDQQELWSDDEVVCGDVKVCTGCGDELPLSRYYKNKLGKQGRQASCIGCQRKQAEKQLAISTAVLHAYTQGRGSCCELCTTKMPTAILHLHHVDPTTKTRSMSVGHWTAGPKGAQTAKEAESCALLCPNCHMTEHYLLDRGFTSFPSAYSTPDGTKPPLNIKEST
jgi:hypothetical protein